MNYRVRFPDGEVWKINLPKGVKAADAPKVAFTRASAARAAEGKTGPVAFEDVVVQKVTAKLRAELKGVEYMDRERMLEACQEIGQEYKDRGMALTLRGMYYQLVSRGLLASGQEEYNRVKSTLSQARLRGTFPLDLLSDSSRDLRAGQSTRYDLNVESAVRQAANWVPQLDHFFIQAARWYRQRNLPIVLFEKEALTNVFGPLCDELGVPWMATRGYPSISILYEVHNTMVAAMDPALFDYDLSEDIGRLEGLDPSKEADAAELDRIHEDVVYRLISITEDGGYWTDRQEFDEDDDRDDQHDLGRRWRYRYGDLEASQWHQGSAQTVRILYFGDHDPDGMEIPLDLERRIRVIQTRTEQIVPFTVERLGLNRDQIEQYNPPPFFAKVSSARYEKYIDEHGWAGERAWELDALDPTVLRDIARQAVNGYFDEDICTRVAAQVQQARDRFNHRMRSEVLPKLLAGGS